jgi:hypothetical protein
MNMVADYINDECRFNPEAAAKLYAAVCKDLRVMLDQRGALPKVRQ